MKLQMINKIHTFSFKRKDLKENKSEAGSSTKIRSVIGATIGTALPIAVMMKKQKIINPLKLKYDLKDMVILSCAPIIGGTLGGMINENSKGIKTKVKEGAFQFLNAALPAIFVAGGLNLCEKYKKFNTISCKLAVVAGGILAGIYSSLKLTNVIFKHKDKPSERKLNPADCLASADDAIGALALAKLPRVQYLQLNKALPAIYAYCGYRAGKAN